MSKLGRRAKAPAADRRGPGGDAPTVGPAASGDGQAAAAAAPAFSVMDGPPPHLLDPNRERTLVEAAQAGDAGAIEALYRTHHATIYRYVLFRVGSVAVAEDVTSQVFLGMMRQLPRYRWQGKPFLSWLYAIAQKQVAMHFRSSARAGSPVDLEQAESVIADTAGPHADAEQRERRVALARALDTLPESQREVILLRFVLALSLAETAAAVDKSEGAVKQLQLRGLAALKDVLGAYPPA